MVFKDQESRKEYFRIYNKEWYRRHRERLLEKGKQHDIQLREWLREYKSKLCCMVCGETHPACLQFHHRDKMEKSFNIGHMIGRRNNLSFKTLEKEINKCDILCGNCHAKLHWQERQKETENMRSKKEDAI